ncbi:DNA polymerase-4 [Scopulibacillus darangshiensis]|uniref:DNA polymerase IV n=1 Tax=Scopulibacillus darangshiensis TaxID=442528 RepID=A0A4R2P9R9_9BACL|nr:DNA polymerase IV [Scopulibacillus darangshiensis]TCP31800.1 DNA polymerase-4 [Scopulibacillus darangshiensis]
MGADQSQGPRVIFHIDMNSFYASVEIAKDPGLKGKALAIAGKVEDRRGIVVTSSYEARAQGVKTTMPVWEARRHCPELIIKTPDFPLYRSTSKQLFELLRSYTDTVEKVSIDEGYMDVTAALNGIHPLQLAKNIQRKVLDALHLPSSIGIAPNKFLAKMASDMKKPMGITVLRKREIAKVLWPLPIGEMYGVGPKTEAKLKHIGVQTIGDLAQNNAAALVEKFGVYGERLYKRANGIDHRPVDPEAENTYKSISQSTTLPEDTTSDTVVRKVLSILAEKIADKLKQEKVTAYQTSLMIRYNDWQNITRNQTVKQPIQSKDDISHIAGHLFDRHWDGRPVRLLGITVTALEELYKATKQLDLFSYQADVKKEPLMDLISEMDHRYGEGTLRSASLYKKEEP